MLRRLLDRVAGRRAEARRLLPFVAVALVVLLAAAGGWLVASWLDDEEEPAAPAPQIFIRDAAAPEETEELGFPAFATRNTTRIGAADATATAAAVALAVFPSSGGLEGPPAVAIADAGDPHSAIAAASLFAPPLRTPLLLSEGRELPELTADALAALAPSGSAATERRQAFVLGRAARPAQLRTRAVDGANPAELAAGIARLRAELTDEDPRHVIVASSDELAYAMPAAAWAARSGDPVLYAQRDSVPAPTRRALRRWKRTAVYLLGPESVLSRRVERELEKVAGRVRRVGAEGPVENAIEFARYADGDFGWDINDPGHGFVIANSARPADAGAAAPLSASGAWGPLLVTDAADAPPPALAGYLLDLKPGYVNDPTRAVYNRVWIVGDEEAVSVGFQARVDELAELAPVRSGTGAQDLGPKPPEPETPQDDPGTRGNSRKGR